MKNLTSNTSPLKDSFGRSISSLRISITDRCNLNCIYCHHEGNTCDNGTVPKEISIQTIQNIVTAAQSHGVTKLKFSGGEPLLRNDFEDILTNLPEMKNISVTTNGTLLSGRAHELKESGLDRINISLDTLDPEKYKVISGKGPKNLDRAIDGVYTAVDAGLLPVKINMVLLNGMNDTEIEPMMEFTRQFGPDVVLQLIELMDFSSNGIESYSIDADKIEEYLKSISDNITTRTMHRRNRYSINGSIVEFVRPIDNSKFCAGCNRLRVTPQGQLKPCLLVNDNLVDVNELDIDAMHEMLELAVSRRIPFCR
ncbi:GTP 3',8-cyclase MoaA [Methanosalsum natronophilum]|uniref:GTP 3',8-cyclase MoaA n=1 Tax=Methanosalsum natronophilum TaxID=768733 RepID=UPI0021673FA2|nr:GTP 3',8-cyclase MoaA [Methanosalsum natronophilum]MCS3923709.1 cyclic pyranopterin phosphate synthase [Methanosalsum natronophilum]